MSDEIGVTDRLRQWRLAQRPPLSQSETARLLGVSERAVQSWEQGKREPSYESIETIERLIASDDIQAVHTRLLTIGEEPLAYNAELVRVRVMEAGAGPGRDNGSEARFDVFSRDYLERIDKSHAEQLVVGTVVGNSMAPAFSPGSRFFYRPIERVVGSGSYVISIDGDEVLKDVTKWTGGALVVGSRNKDYPPETLIPTEEAGMYRSEATGLVVRLQIVGKVVGVVTLE